MIKRGVRRKCHVNEWLSSYHDENTETSFRGRGPKLNSTKGNLSNLRHEHYLFLDLVFGTFLFRVFCLYCICGEPGKPEWLKSWLNVCCWPGHSQVKDLSLRLKENGTPPYWDSPFRGWGGCDSKEFVSCAVYWSYVWKPSTIAFYLV